jgi:cysteine-rich repeat protein
MRAALLLFPLLSSCTWIILERLRDSDPESLCGNGIAQIKLGEECDGQDLQEQTCVSLDPRFISGQLSCSLDCAFDTSACQEPLNCSNGIIDGGEQCDDQNFSDNDGCSALCQFEDGFTCNDAEPTICQSICGDGLRVGFEQCDDQNTDETDGCLSTCISAPGFECLGDPVVCFLPRCGDGIKDDGEECDDANSTTGDGCDFQCRIEPGFTCNELLGVCFLPECGDGDLDLGEQCDDGCGNDGVCDTSDNNDGCESSCRFICGGDSGADLAFFFQNECYLGFDTALNFDDASAACEDRASHPVVVTSAEEDSLLSSMSARFTSQPLSLWLGMIEGTATGNFDGFVWVTSEHLEDFHLFVAQPVATPNDDCGVRVEGLGWQVLPCDQTQAFVCEIEPRCGDGIVENTNGEVSDDGNNTDGDGCRADCAGFERCGDGVVDDSPKVVHPEECDDTNVVSNDGCSRVCQLEE